MNREVADRVVALRAKRDLMWDLQVAMLILWCQMDRAVEHQERAQEITEESDLLLREAQKYLGPGVREVVA